MDKIRERVAPLNIPVKIDTGRNFDCGYTLSFTGVAGHGDGNASFLISMDILTDMAEDEAVYRKWMAKISERVQQEQELRSFGVNLPPSPEPTTTRHYHEWFLNSRSNGEMCIMKVFDSLNQRNHEIHTRINIPIKTASQIANRYEQMLSVQ